MSSELDTIVKVTISRETTAIAVASFGTPGIVATFATDKTTVEFDRYRFYSGLSEMIDDGWISTDAVYLEASKIFAQNPSPEKVMIGRLDAVDVGIAEGLTAINNATSDWYGWVLQPTKVGKIVYSADFITLNSIDVSVNETAITPVVFDTDQGTTMAALKAQIESDITDSTATIDPSDVSGRTMLISILGESVNTLSSTVTAGASQPTETISFVIEDDILLAAAWSETEQKIMFYSSNDAAIIDSGSTTDIASQLKALGYDRTSSMYHTAGLEAVAPAYPEAAWIGECLPFDPGSQTWMFKTLTGVAADTLSSGVKAIVHGKNANTYTSVAGVSITEKGIVASGEYIDVIRGVDYIKSRLQEAIYTDLVNLRKIPYTDEGIAIIETTVKGVLAEAARKGILIEESIVVTVPKLADIPTADKLARNLPDITWKANLQGAIHRVVIEGIVTV